MGDSRIGQPVDLYVEIYGHRRVFKGRISGFTEGTGSTLALLPPENATGNFIKVVQRLPVRIDLENYDPDKNPLFVGTSVVPYVYFNKPPTGDSEARGTIGAGASLGLPIVGKVLGHSQPATTARYAHLDADPLRRAPNVVGGPSRGCSAPASATLRR